MDKAELLLRAKSLRVNQTDSELKLWYQLRGRQLDGLKFRRQQPIGNYIADFVCYEKRLVIEVDGGQHDEPENREKDTKRTT